MQNKNDDKITAKSFSRDTSEMRKAPGYTGAVPVVNTPEISTPGISLPEINPPVPNRAWTEMKREYESGERDILKRDR